jgi:hypothetical protein
VLERPGCSGDVPDNGPPDCDLDIVSTSSGARHTVPLPGPPTFGSEIDPTARWLALTIVESGRVVAVDLATGSVQPVIEPPDRRDLPHEYAWSPDGRWLVLPDAGNESPLGSGFALSLLLWRPGMARPARVPATHTGSHFVNFALGYAT